MRELLHDIEDMRSILRRRMLRAAVAASGKMARAVSGHDAFQSDHQLRACVAMLRLAPALVGELEEKTSTWDDPKWYDPFHVRCWEVLDTKATRDDWARWWLRAFRLHGPLEGAYASNAEAQDYGRQRYDEKQARGHAECFSGKTFEQQMLNEGDHHE